MNLDKFQEQFKEHILQVEYESDKIKQYLFKNPNSPNLWQRWIFSNGNLIVTGDCYDSIYRGGPFQSIQSVAECNLSYFSSKCVADADGKSQSKFDGDVATEEIHNMIFANFDDLELFVDTDTKEEKINNIISYLNEQEETKARFNYVPLYFDDEWDTVVWVRSHTYIVGEDWWDGLNMNKKNMQPYWHLAALKEASKKLELVTA